MRTNDPGIVRRHRPPEWSAYRPMLAAAAKFREQWQAGMDRSAEGATLSDRDIVQMHEAALALVWATGTSTIEEALSLLQTLEA